jgi:2-methylcitrate dehydratase PrpD
VTFTDHIVDIALTATPPDDALVSARTQLDEIRAALGHGVVAIGNAHPGGQPSPMNSAWRGVIATAALAQKNRWHAIAVTVVALQDISAHDGTSAAAATAVASGSAIADRIAAALASTSAADRWSHRAVAGLIGAGVAAGRLLDFDEAQLRNVVGLCATQAAGLHAVDESESAIVQLAKTAADAVEAAVLARHGFTSSADGIGGRRGLFALLAPDATWQGDSGAA